MSKLLERLTPRQEEAVRLRAQFKTFKEVGEAMGIGCARARFLTLIAVRKCGVPFMYAHFRVPCGSEYVDACSACCAALVRIDAYTDHWEEANRRSEELFDKKHGHLLTEIRNVQAPPTRKGARNMTLPEQITRDVLENAPMFTIFEVRDKVIPTTRFKLWNVFNEGEERFSPEVALHLEGQGIHVNGHVQRDDYLVQLIAYHWEDEPSEYDDVDAALDAIASGMKLVKVPDKMHATYWHMYVCGEKKDG